MIDVFKIGVAISMTSNANQVLGVLLQDLIGVKKGAAAASSSLTSVKLAALGAGAALAGIGALDGLWKAVEAGKELNHQLELMQNRGGDFATQLQQIHKAAAEAAQAVPTSRPSDNVKMVGELGSQIGVGNAQSILPMVAKLQLLIGKGGQAGTPEDIQALLKTIEIRGKMWKKDADGNEIRGADGKPQIDMASVQSEMTAAWQAIASQGGLLTPQMLLQMAKQGALSVGQQSIPVFYFKGPEGAISQGASRIGTALARLASEFEGGVMTLHVAEELQKLGILQQGEWKEGRGGHIVVTEEARHRNQGIVQDPYAWAKDELIPLMKTQGMSALDMSAELVSLLGRQTTQRMMSEFINNPESFDRAVTNAQNVHGIDQSYAELQKNDLTTNILAFHEAFNGLIEELSLLGAPGVIGVLHGLTDDIHYLTSEITAHPMIAQDVLALAGALAAFMAITGTALMVAALISMTAALGPFVALAASVTAMATAVGLLPVALHQIADFVNGVLGIVPPRTDNPRGGNQGSRGSLSGDPGHGGGYDPDYPAEPPPPSNSGHNLHYQGDGSDGGRHVHVQKQSYVPPSATRQPIELHSIVYMDGRKVAKV